MNKQEQIEEMTKETRNKQWQRIDEYCLRIQKAIQYKGNDDHEDVWSILVDYEKELIPDTAVVLSREELKAHDIALVEKFVERLKDTTLYWTDWGPDKDFARQVDEVAKEITEGSK